MVQKYFDMGDKKCHIRELVSKCSSLFKVKGGENFSRGNTFPYFEEPVSKRSSLFKVK